MEPYPLRAQLAAAEVAFVGTVVGTRVDASADGGLQEPESTFARVRVDRPVKGTFDSDAEILFVGVQPRVGVQAAFLPYRHVAPGQPERWLVGACGGVVAVEAVDAAMSPPPVTGSGPLRHVALVPLGDLRVVGLDEGLRPLGYGAGPGVVASLAVCPRGRRSVEVVTDGSGRRLAVRDLRTLAVVTEIDDDRLVRTPERPFDELTVACRSAAGDDLAVFLGGPSPQGPSELHRWVSGRWSTLWTGGQKSAAASADGQSMYLVGGPEPLVVGVDTATGRQRTLARTDTSLSRPQLGPDERTLRVWTATGQWQNERFLEVRLDEGAVAELPLPMEGDLRNPIVVPDLGPVGATGGVVVVRVPLGSHVRPEYVPSVLELGPGSSVPAAPGDVEWTGGPSVASGALASTVPRSADGNTGRGGTSGPGDVARAVAVASVVALVGLLLVRRRRGSQQAQGS